MPESSFSLQHTLSNGKRADCILFLPEPTGNIAIDAKSPLEDYQIMYASDDNSNAKKQATQRFKQMVKKHINELCALIPIKSQEQT